MKSFLFYNKFKFGILIFLKIIASALMVGLALVLQYLVNALNGGVAIQKFGYVVLFTILYIGVVALVYLVKDAFTMSYVNTAVKNLKDKFSEKLLTMRYEDFSKNDSAKYISNLTNDMKLISQNYFHSILVIPEEIFTFLIAVGVAFYLHWVVALTMLGLTMLIFVVPLVFNRPLNKANLELSESMSEFTQIIKQTFLGIDVVKNFSSEEKTLERIRNFNLKLAKKNTIIDRLNVFAMDVGIVVVAILQVGSIGVAGYLMLKGQLDIGAIIAVVQLGSFLFAPLMNVAGKVALINGIKDLNKEISFIFDTVAQKDCGLKGFKDKISLVNVNYKYSGEERYVLENINLDIAKGAKCLIVGKSGSGKSTILKLLAKMYNGYEGSITLDGRPFSEISEHELNRVVSVSQQRSYLFNLSIKDNIDFNGTRKEEKLNAAIKLACLKKFVSMQENGIDTVVNEEVNQISGGEKLRIGLARALYKDAEILLLDEVTSALDKDTAHEVESNVLNLQEKTLINVSHKIHKDLLPRYDKICIIESGKIIMYDSADKVIESKAFKKYLSEDALAAV